MPARPGHRGRRLPWPSLPAGLPRAPLPARLPLPGGRGRPRPAPSTEIHNYRVMRRDSVAMGVIAAATTFLPVFVARLGGSAVDIGLLTAIPAVGAVLLAIPIGQYLQGRSRIVHWYSRSRMIAHLAY